VIQTIPLPYGGKVEVCDICGNAESSSIKKCRDAGAPQPTPYQVGQRVSIYRKQWKGNGSVRSDEREEFVVTGLRYGSPLQAGFHLAMAIAANSAGAAEAFAKTREPVHRLEVSMRQDLPNGAHGLGTWTVDELQLWQEGDPVKLEAAGLIRPPKPFLKRRRRWWWPF
jgi:hypothetical protein